MADAKEHKFFHRLNTRKRLGDDYDDFIREIVFINITRIKILIFPMLVLFCVLILFDYINIKAGRWALSPGYRIIFFTHLSAQILLIIFSVFLYFNSIARSDQVKMFHRRINQIMIQLFCFHMTVIAMGDAFNSGSIAAYLGSIFAIASFVFTTNGFALQLFASNLILMIGLLLIAGGITGESYSIQIMNAVIYVAISFLLSRLLFYYQLRDFINRRLIRRQNERLEKLAMYDHLTGVLNRRSFLEQARKELLRSERYQYPVGVMLFDIDFFKKVNDTYGHAAGDSVLVSVSRAVQENIRSSDLLARWGGEEFIVLSPETDAGRIAAAAEKLRQVIEATKPDDGPGVTASFGVTCCQAQETVDEVIHRADMALYNAKDSGRNCVKTL